MHLCVLALAFFATAGKHLKKKFVLNSGTIYFSSH